MKTNTIRHVIIFATISIIGIVGIQVFWVRKAIDIKDRQFNHNVNLALRTVADHIYEINGNKLGNINPVKQLSSNYFVVMVNDELNASKLEDLLITEFQSRSLTSAFEYGIYDCENDEMVYGDFISFDDKAKAKKSKLLPVTNQDSYYFGVFFPNKSSLLLSQMGIWIFSSIVFIVVIIFFAYTLYIIMRQKRLSEIQRDFVNNMTHELKTPISTILISSEVLKSLDLNENDERLKNYANIIYDEADRLKNNVERVLQMERIDRKKIELKLETLNINNIIKQVTDKLKDVSNKPTDISLNLKSSVSQIRADKFHLMNVIFNLLDNALKYTIENPTISISTEDCEKGVKVNIADNGPGIDAQYQKRVFEKFFRIPTGDIHDVKGFGLGLNYVKTVVKAHKGSVSLDSQPGKGSSFSFILPTK